MIQTGVARFDSQMNGWNLSTGTGVRSFSSPDIAFQPPFPAPPTLVLALSGLDSEHSVNLRVTLQPYDVEAEEFNIIISTWDDTILHGVTVTWIAHD
jgi:hypothetical protein